MERRIGRLITWKELKELVPLSRTQIWRLERAGKFPRRIRIGERRIAWREREIREWMQTRPRGLGRCGR